MDRDLYAKCWGKGPVAVQRKQLIKDGLLDKHGEIIEGKTPESYINRHLDVQKFLETAGATCANSIKVERPEVKQTEWNTVDVCGDTVQQEKPEKESKEDKKDKKEEKKEKKSDESKSHKEKKEHRKDHKDKSEKHKDKSHKEEKHEHK